ncbi:MAG: succinylglutamate desuccinylase [Devosia sp.]|uniref:succinylglutamate desuccinylase/aspartoacylase family protein n=1 Tax=Devosia sp. TaxID=1871048 RepID=UPI00261D5722|nr:succinylglutamate desuccinylase/aspartoacylase family protein [Devosia sp.]MDB5585355.1 succinylglutamate desuccinylase [Devosia sp.]
MNALPSFRTGTPRLEQGYVQPLPGIDIPFTVIEGTQPGPVLLVTAGVHASEFCSIEAAIRLQQTKPESLKGTLVILPILNMQGFRKRSIYIMPEDGKNLNRQFPGKPDGTLSEQLAFWLSDTVFPQADAYLDLHGGDLDESLLPFTIYPRGDAGSKALATAFGIKIAIASDGKTNSINGAVQHGIPSLLPEMSGNGLWDNALVGELTDGIARVMLHLGMIDGPVKPAPQVTPDFVTMWVPTAPMDGLWYSAKQIAETVETGEVLGEIRDVFGVVLATIRSEKAGIVVYRMTSLSVNQGEALLGIGSPLVE